MIVFHLGPPQRRMVASWHAPEAGGRGPARRVLLVAPFGQEEIRSRRLFRVVAERLVRLGHGVLRFDRFACGDADGTDDEADLEGWVGDVACAAAELERRCPGAEDVWLGARLGATLVLQAAQRAPGFRRLVLWDPVLDGPAYLDHLRDAQGVALHAMGTASDPLQVDALASAIERAGNEVMGFGFPPRLLERVRALRPDLLGLPTPSVATVLSSAPDPALGLWCRSQAEPVAVQEAPAFEWTSDRAINSALVPSEAVQALVRAVDG